MRPAASSIVAFWERPNRALVGPGPVGPRRLREPGARPLGTSTRSRTSSRDAICRLVVRPARISRSATTLDNDARAYGVPPLGSRVTLACFAQLELLRRRAAIGSSRPSDRTQRWNVPCKIPCPPCTYGRHGGYRAISLWIQTNVHADRGQIEWHRALFSFWTIVGSMDGRVCQSVLTSKCPARCC